MYAVNDDIETIHLYVVREEGEKTSILLPLLVALLCLSGIGTITLYSAAHPSYEHERLSVPARFLPLRTFTAQVPIIPTGRKIYPATFADGTLTLTNGSVLSEVLPGGVLFSAANGVEVQTEQSVLIPAGGATGYGVATVLAKAVVAGKRGNLPTLAVNAVYGTSLYVRNLAPFHGGEDAYAVALRLPQDRQSALTVARWSLTAQKAHVQAILVSRCKETTFISERAVRLSWSCQFVTYHVPPDMKVIALRLAGKNLLIYVVFVARPQNMLVR